MAVKFLQQTPKPAGWDTEFPPDYKRGDQESILYRIDFPHEDLAAEYVDH